MKLQTHSKKTSSLSQQPSHIHPRPSEAARQQHPLQVLITLGTSDYSASDKPRCYSIHNPHTPPNTHGHKCTLSPAHQHPWFRLPGGRMDGSQLRTSRISLGRQFLAVCLVSIFQLSLLAPKAKIRSVVIHGGSSITSDFGCNLG